MNITVTKCKCFSGYSGDNCEILSTKIRVIKGVIDTSAVFAIITIVSFAVLVILMDISKFLMKKKQTIQS